MIEIIEICDSLRNKYNDELINFTKNFVYPFGSDSFTIDHGKNYFAFLDRLGKPLSFIAVVEGKIVGTVTIIARNIGIYDNGHLEEVWYICDLKIGQQFRGQFIIQKFLKFIAEKYNGKFTHLYGISMNNGDLSDNKVAKFAQVVPNVNLRERETLVFYLLSSSQISRLDSILQKYYKIYSFVSLAGIKDLTLSSTHLNLPFVHFSTKSQGRISQSKMDYQYMLCLPLSHNIIADMRAENLSYFTTASIISNMENVNWSFIETGDI